MKSGSLGHRTGTVDGPDTIPVRHPGALIDLLQPESSVARSVGVPIGQRRQPTLQQRTLGNITGKRRSRHGGYGRDKRVGREVREVGGEQRKQESSRMGWIVQRFSWTVIGWPETSPSRGHT